MILFVCVFVFYPKESNSIIFKDFKYAFAIGYSLLTSVVVSELSNCIMQAIKKKQSRRTDCKSKRSAKNHTQLILLLFEMTIKDNGYVSRQLDQQCKENAIQERTST